MKNVGACVQREREREREWAEWKEEATIITFLLQWPRTEVILSLSAPHTHTHIPSSIVLKLQVLKLRLYNCCPILAHKRFDNPLWVSQRPAFAHITQTFPALLTIMHNYTYSVYLRILPFESQRPTEHFTNCSVIMWTH